MVQGDLTIESSSILNQDLTNDASPIFAGVTLTGFGGIVQATAGVLSASTDLADGTTATTQSANDNSTKVSTTAYVDSATGNSTLTEVLTNGNATGGNNISLTSGDDVSGASELDLIATTDLTLGFDSESWQFSNAFDIDTITSSDRTLKFTSSSAGNYVIQYEASGTGNSRFQLIKGGDSNGWLRFEAAGPTTRMDFGSSVSNFDFNFAGSDVDFRLRGDTDTMLLYADAGNDRIGIGDNTPSEKLQVAGNILADDYVYQDGTYDEVSVSDNSTATNVATGATYTKFEY